MFQALRTAGQAEAEKLVAAPVPAVPIRKSVVPLSMVGIWRPLGGNG
jgi:hypothetical protein